MLYPWIFAAILTATCLIVGLAIADLVSDWEK